MSYFNYVLNYIRQQETGVLIYISEIKDKMASDFKIGRPKAAAATSVAIKRIMDRSSVPDLHFIRNGVYCRIEPEYPGISSISIDKLIENAYILPWKGYETGRGLLHQMGLLTEAPPKRVIASNLVKGNIRYDKRLEVYVCPPKAPVNQFSKAYLQVLDALNLIGRTPVDVENPYQIIAEFIHGNSLSYETLLYYADHYYSRDTVLQVAHSAGIRDLNILDSKNNQKNCHANNRFK